ncbi:MAG: hypothetical protein WAK98_11210, partial [Gemmobacter sp.]
ALHSQGRFGHASLFKLILPQKEDFKSKAGQALASQSREVSRVSPDPNGKPSAGGNPNKSHPAEHVMAPF